MIAITIMSRPTLSDSSFQPYRMRIQRAASPSDVQKCLGVHHGPMLPEGTHFLVSETTGTPFFPLIQILMERAPNRFRAKLSVSPRTAEAFASDLADYFAFLDFAKVTWNEIDEATLLQYVDSMIEEPSPTTSEPYADETIRRRISSVRKLYKWAQPRGMTKHNVLGLDLRTELKTRRYSYGAQTEGNGAHVPCAPSPDREVRPIPPDEIARIFARLGTLPSTNTVQDARATPSAPAKLEERSCRNRLMAECAFQVGLRRQEVVDLELPHIMQIGVDAAAPFILHPVRVFGKGAKWRTVNIPSWLIDALQIYARGERAAVVGCANRSHTKLFVSLSSNPKFRGQPLTAKSLDDIFAAAVIAEGLTRTVKRADAEGKSIRKEVAKHVFHDLRHNFAILTYYTRKANGDAEPWLYIQAMLGHALLQTTIRIYLRLVKAYESKYSDYLTRKIMDIARSHG